jgi:hypothetical protein
MRLNFHYLIIKLSAQMWQDSCYYYQVIFSTIIPTLLIAQFHIVGKYFIIHFIEASFQASINYLLFVVGLDCIIFAVKCIIPSIILIIISHFTVFPSNIILILIIFLWLKFLFEV